MLNSDLSPAALQGGGDPTHKTCVVTTRRRIQTNWVTGRTLQPSIESVVANSFVQSDFLVNGQVSGLGTVHPLHTLNFFSTWILPLLFCAQSPLAVEPWMIGAGPRYNWQPLVHALLVGSHGQMGMEQHPSSAATRVTEQPFLGSTLLTSSGGWA